MSPPVDPMCRGFLEPLRAPRDTSGGSDVWNADGIRRIGKVFYFLYCLLFNDLLFVCELSFATPTYSIKHGHCYKVSLIKALFPGTGIARARKARMHRLRDRLAEF